MTRSNGDDLYRATKKCSTRHSCGVDLWISGVRVLGLQGQEQRFGQLTAGKPAVKSRPKLFLRHDLCQDLVSKGCRE